MHLLTYKAVSEYIALAGTNGLWRRVRWKMTCLYLLLIYNGVSVCSVSHRKTCLCATCHLHISLWFVRSGMFPRKCLDYKTHSFASSHTKRCVSAHFWLMRTCLSTAWHLLSYYFDCCERNMGRVHSKRRYADVSTYNFWRSRVSVH